MPIHRHRNTSETVVVLRGKLVLEYYDGVERRCTESNELSANGDVVAMNVPAGQYHTVKARESGLEEVPGQARDEGPRTGRMNPSAQRMCWRVDIPKNVWHKLESLEAGSVIFECKVGAFVEHEEEGILEVKSEK